MKICLSCQTHFAADGWTCPSCNQSPFKAHGFLAFAPFLNEDEGGFALEAHSLIDQIQERSFWFRGRNKIILSQVRRHVPQLGSEDHPGTVLEIGCGTGFVLSALAKTYPQTTFIGAEAHSAALPFAGKRVPKNVTLIQCDGRDIPYHQEFDMVCAFDVLEHIEDDAEVLTQLHNATADGGKIVVTVPQHPALWSASDDIARHKRRYGRGEIAAKVKSAGFDILTASSFVTFLLPIMFASRLIGDNAQAAEAEFALPRLIDNAFEFTLSAERTIIGMGLSLPVGGSAIVVAQKI